jgi:hypothetical protein
MIEIRDRLTIGYMKDIWSIQTCTGCQLSANKHLPTTKARSYHLIPRSISKTTIVFAPGFSKAIKRGQQVSELNNHSPRPPAQGLGDSGFYGAAFLRVKLTQKDQRNCTQKTTG